MSQQQTRITPQEVPPLAVVVRRAFAHKPFVIAVIVMAVAAFGIGAATQFLQLKFKKLPVPLTRELELTPSRLGPWVQVSKDAPLEADIEHTLGTKKYIFRDYVDSRLIGQSRISELLAKDEMRYRQMLAEITRATPRAVLHLAVTYYSGMVDTVAHVPDRCYIADGYTPSDYETRRWKLAMGTDAAGNEKEEEVEVRFINFEDATGFTSRESKTVAYFFQVNGHMESDPVSVRFRLQNLFQSDVYYAKVELMMTQMRGREETARIMTDFLSSAMPEIRACLPQAAGQKQPATGPVAAVEK